MTTCTEHDPVRLFGFALRERDWVLAELLRRSLRGDPATLTRMERELERLSGEAGVPPTLASLRWMAAIERTLERSRGRE